MLDLLAFDLDGTLVLTEPLKAEAYGWAAHRLRPDVAAADVEASYGDCIGRSRQEIATRLLHRFGLTEAARDHDPSVPPWQALSDLRLVRYREALDDPEAFRRHGRPQALALVGEAHRLARRVAVVTTSANDTASGALRALGLTDAFDLVLTADDVARTKPDPEAYRLALDRLGAEAGRSVAIEDSPVGVRAALAAGLHVVACPTDDTRADVEAMVRSGALDGAALVAQGGLAEAVRRAALSPGRPA